MERDIEKDIVLNHIDNGININGESDCEDNIHCPNCNQVIGDY